jgi:hypothetical protein
MSWYQNYRKHVKVASYEAVLNAIVQLEQGLNPTEVAARIRGFINCDDLDAFGLNAPNDLSQHVETLRTQLGCWDQSRIQQQTPEMPDQGGLNQQPATPEPQTTPV